MNEKTKLAAAACLILITAGSCTVYKSSFTATRDDGSAGRVVEIAYEGVESISRITLSRRIEDLMLDLMYNLPSQKKVKEVVVTKEVVEDREKPVTLIEKAG